MPGGRPTGYTPELGELICERIAQGTSLLSITEEPDMPSYSMVMRWVINYAEFREKYTHARENQADAFIDKGAKELDNATGKDEIIGAARRAEVRLKFAEKMHPRKYGNKLELSGSLEMKMSDDQLDARLALLLGKAGIDTTAGGEGTPEETA